MIPYKVRARISHRDGSFYLLIAHHELQVEGGPAPSPKVIKLISLPSFSFSAPLQRVENYVGAS